MESLTPDPHPVSDLENLNYPLTIGVFTGNEDTKNRRTIQEVHALGEEIIQKGHSLVFGGSELGQMGVLVNAAFDAREKLGGADKHPSKIWGITLETWIEYVSSKCDNVRSYHKLEDRLNGYRMYCDCFISIGGGLGTYAETFFFLESIRSNCLRKPVFVIEDDHEDFPSHPNRANMHELPNVFQVLFAARYTSADITSVDFKWFRNRVYCESATSAVRKATIYSNAFERYYDIPRARYKADMMKKNRARGIQETSSN